MINNNQNKYLSFVKKQFSEFVIVLVVISMFTNIFTINQASAYFSDEATIEGSTFTAGTLEISSSNIDTFSSNLLYPTDSISTSIDISNTGSLESQYIVKTAPIGSDNSACSYISMTASNGSYTYTGLINNFTSDTIQTTDSTWNYNFTVSPTAPSNIGGATCYFSWNYTAWQNNLPNASSGFTSTIEKSGAIKIGKGVVLNEILYNPKSTDQSPSNKEFIELYNNSNIAIDITGWKVSEMSGSTEQKYTITTSGGSNTAAPYNGSTIISPNGWITLILSDTSALNNTGDTVRLYDATNNKLDEYTYTGNKPQGFSDARIPNGIGAWVDPIPTPGESNDQEKLIIPEINTPEIKAEDIKENIDTSATKPEPLTAEEDTNKETISEDTTTDDNEAVPEEAIPPITKQIENEVIAEEEVIAKESEEVDPEEEAPSEKITKEELTSEEPEVAPANEDESTINE